MTHEEFQIVLDVLRESHRLSNADAQALTIEVARRVLAHRPEPTCACWKAEDERWTYPEILVGHLDTCRGAL